MFILIENEQTVHLGPLHWNQNVFQSYIKDDLEIDTNLPVKNDTNDPIIINSNFKIIPVNIVYPDTHNPKIEQYAGPFWTIVNNVATGTYTNSPKPIDVVKNELKAIIATNRWIEETKGITVNIQGQDVRATTKRGERDIFLQALQLMTPTDTKDWKFGNIWLTLTYTDLQTIVTAIVTHIQSAFNWDKAKGTEIDNAMDLNSLDAIMLTVDNSVVGNSMPSGRVRRNAI